MGRPKLSDEEKHKRGTFQKVRATSGKIVPLNRMPPMPAWLCIEGQKIWREQGPKLVRDGLLSDSDTQNFAKYCQFSGMFERIMAKLSEKTDADQWITSSSNGTEMIDPLFKMAMDCQNQSDKIARQFGLSPATRKNVPKKAEKKGNPFQNMKSGTNG